MSFASPLLLLTLLLVPATAALAVAARRRRARYPVVFTNLEILSSVQTSSWSRKAWVPLGLMLLALTCAGAALAQPHITRSKPQAHAVVVMLVDVSGSMAANDIKPTRIQAAVSAMKTFVGKLPKQAEVGLVEFSTEPTVIDQPTMEHDDVTSALDYLFPQGATALGDGIGTAVDVAQYTLQTEGAQRDSQGFEPAAIVLLSDGAQNRGELTPAQAATRAKAAGIRIYTIAFGTPHGVMRFGEGPGGIVHVPPDPTTMRQIASITDGKVFLARNADQAMTVYQGLGSAIARTTSRVTLTSWLSLASGLLLVAAVGTGLTLGQVLP